MAYYKLRQVLQSATRLITNCDGTCTWSTLKFLSTFQTISISSYRSLTNLTSYTRKLIRIFTIFESLMIHSVCSEICISSCFQKLFRKYSILPIVYAERGGKQCIMGNSNHSILSIYTNEFLSKMNKTGRKSLSSKAEPAITCNRKFYPKYVNEHEEE